MSDIVERLEDNSGSHINGLYDCEAAATIRSLRAELAQAQAKVDAARQYAAETRIRERAAEDARVSAVDRADAALAICPITREEWAKALNQRAAVEDAMLQAAKRGESATPEQLRAWAMQLGVPNNWREFGRRQQSSLDAALALLRDLLAVIHRDGGHYTGTHGIEKSAKDAQAVVSAERVALDAALALLRNLYNALRNRHYGRMPDEVQSAYDAAGALLGGGNG